jgi:hypothetical protein
MGDASRLLRAAVLLLDDAALVEAVEWSPALKRPTALVHWGFGVELNGFPPTGPQNIRQPGGPIERGSAAESDLSGQIKVLTAETGMWLAQGLHNRVGSQSFGDWAIDARGSKEHPGITLLDFAPIDGLLSQSRAARADVLMAIALTYRTESGRANTTMLVQLYDVETGEKLWEAKPLSKSKIYSGRLQGKDYPSELASTVLEFVDKDLVLRSAPKLAARDVERRVAAIRSKKYVDPLAALIELRYLQLKKLLPADAAQRELAKIVGEEKVAQLVSADAAERLAAIARFLPGDR